MPTALKTERMALTGNEAVAEAMRQINPDVVAAYPITPQTALVQQFASFAADGKVDTELIQVESEHSAMSAVVGAAASGARSMTATSANGLALMWEIVYICASCRLPVVMPVVNRALSGPINIHCDHSDTMGCRDSGWIQIYAEDAQEAYVHAVLGFRITEHPDILLPLMSCHDGFIISHGIEGVDIFPDEAVKEWVGTYKAEHSLIDVDNPITIGPLDLTDFYFEHKREQIEAMTRARKAIPGVLAEFENAFGVHLDWFETYRCDDAEVIMVALGSTAGTARVAVDTVREQGVKAGLIKLRFFRPFPDAELAEVLGKAKSVVVLDRAASFGAPAGPLWMEVRSALYGKTNIPIIDFIYGLGGRDIKIGELCGAIQAGADAIGTSPAELVLGYLGLRE